MPRPLRSDLAPPTPSLLLPPLLLLLLLLLLVGSLLLVPPPPPPPPLLTGPHPQPMSLVMPRRLLPQQLPLAAQPAR